MEVVLTLVVISHPRRPKPGVASILQRSIAPVNCRLAKRRSSMKFAPLESRHPLMNQVDALCYTSGDIWAERHRLTTSYLFVGYDSGRKGWCLK
jgi:hypothetical protein